MTITNAIQQLGTFGPVVDTRGRCAAVRDGYEVSFLRTGGDSDQATDYRVRRVTDQDDAQTDATAGSCRPNLSQALAAAERLAEGRVAVLRRLATCGTGGIAATVGPVVDVAIVPAVPAAPLAPVVDVVLVPRHSHLTDTARGNDGAACSSGCGYCGRCSCGQRGTIACADCGGRYVKGECDNDNYCDGCRAERDAHTDALELRMAKAGLPAADRTTEVA